MRNQIWNIVLEDTKLQFWPFRGHEFLFLEKISHLKVFQIHFETLISYEKIKSGNLRRSKTVIYVILEALT